jgi:hypothetical protein
VSDRRARAPVGKTLLAAWRHLCYKLAYHRLFSLSLRHWIWVAVALPLLAAWVGLLDWAWAIPFSVLGAAALAGLERARAKQYVLFDPALQPAFPQGPEPLSPLQADQPLLCWASGRLGVEGKTRALAGERASFSFVRTREHIVMAQVRRTRFLLLAPVSKADAGYWYAFFHPQRVRSVRPGTLYNGFTRRPGLELWTVGEKSGERALLYLGFEDRAARRRVLDDLRRDVQPEAFGDSI